MRLFFSGLLIFFISASSFHSAFCQKTVKPGSIYHKGWIDFNKDGKMDVYEDPASATDLRVEDLLSQMTLDEKTCQLATLYGYVNVLQDELPAETWKSEIWKDGICNIDEHLSGERARTQYSYPHSRHAEAVNLIQKFFVEETRLGIPVDFTNEGIVGLCHDRATLFPTQIGLASSWDRELVSKVGDITGKEARAMGYTNVYSPILDLSRDPRWGRTVETYGEDPYLVSQLGKQQILALQKNRVVSTPKHFALYSIPIGGRDEGTRTDPKTGPREMHSVHLEPFRVAFREAGALGVMSSYNDYDGIPVTGSKYFLTTLLREQFGFKGYVVSDSDALEYLYTKHKVTGSYKEAVARAINAGLNVRTTFTMPQHFILPLRQAFTDGLISRETLDSRVRDVLQVKFWLGLFDQPYVPDPGLADKVVASAEHKAVALDASRKAIVLLKNENNLLPLSKEIRTIAVIGPNANASKGFITRYGPPGVPVITVFDGIKSLVPPGTQVFYAKGCEIVDREFPESEILPPPFDSVEIRMIQGAVDTARLADVVIMVLGETERVVGESKSRAELKLTGRQEELLKAIHATGKPVVLVLINGRPLAINWADRYIPAIVEAWFDGEFTGIAIAEVLFGDYNPGGKLPVTFPKSVGQIPLVFPCKPASDSKGKCRVSGPLYPFGHGLSYTTFDYSQLRITPDTTGTYGTVTVSANIKNSGTRKGDEVVQLYINDEVSSVTTWVKSLRGFERITLDPGEEKEVTFTLGPRDLGLYDENMDFVVEPGKFNVMMGSSSEDIRLKGSFILLEDPAPGLFRDYIRE